MGDFRREAKMHHAYFMLLTELQEPLTLLVPKAKMLSAVCSPLWISTASNNPHTDEGVDFLAYFAHSPGVRHLFCDLLCFCVPQNITSHYFFFGLILALASNAKEQVIECGCPACILTKGHEARTDDGDKLAIHTATSLSHMFTCTQAIRF